MAARFRWALLLTAATAAHGSSPEGLAIREPRPYAVVQRTRFTPGPTPAEPVSRGSAIVTLVLDGVSPEVASARIRAVPCSDPEADVAWSRVELDAPTADGARRGRVAVAAGGWYRLEAMVDDAPGEPRTAAVEPFGVGEVWLVAGQSYATNTNDERLVVGDPRRRVAACGGDGSWCVADDPQPTPDASDGGSIWPAVGDEIVRAFGVPVGFRNVAWGGTSTARWQPGGELHSRLVTAGKELGRFRAVLWQQGESDVIDGTSTNDYVARVQAIRDAAVEAWGFEPVWLCAFSTHHPTVYRNPEGEARIRAAISRLGTLPGFGLGPETDALQGPDPGAAGLRRQLGPAGQRNPAAPWRYLLLKEATP